MPSTTALDPGEEGVPLAFVGEGLVELGERDADRVRRLPARLTADEQPDLVDLLPLAVEGEERADLEVARGDVDRRADLAPLTDVLERLPVLVAVVDDEEVATSGSPRVHYVRA